ncbi:hypothetical protein EGR_05193 [Echinococcus granulosus]|uniref:Uncharacterized protein n=1 Tax=Echinococcus granulosus TaxID=6210 RepID=W6UP18_ECHGR|nr:hypothetical protein EGR_05193 [Echinococcus granulosus]EUB60032.1 hypothetical protein EGR_05193 [Echinococcus granulosus]
MPVLNDEASCAPLRSRLSGREPPQLLIKRKRLRIQMSGGKSNSDKSMNRWIDKSIFASFSKTDISHVIFLGPRDFSTEPLLSRFAC